MKLRIAIVADWLLNIGGAERVILALHEMFKDAPIFTSVYNKEKNPQFENTVVVTSFLQKLPLSQRKHYLYLPFMPYAFEQFDLSKFDIVISSCHCAAKGIITKPRTLHICFCHSPMRYIWDDCHEYVETYGLPAILKWKAKRMLHHIRLWDRLAADRVDFFVANSIYVKKRIQKYYKRDAEVIYPPVDVEKFKVSQKQGKYYLALGRLTPYKKFDLLINTFNELKFPLIIVGKGKDEKRLKRLAGNRIQFLGEAPEKDLQEIYSEAKALVFPQAEDFGIAPLEAMACGKPVIAFSEGGALETVIPGETGLFFDEQKEESLKRAVLEFETLKWDPQKIHGHALKFDKKVFRGKMLNFIEEKWKIWEKEMV